MNYSRQIALGFLWPRLILPTAYNILTHTAWIVHNLWNQENGSIKSSEVLSFHAMHKYVVPWYPGAQPTRCIHMGSLLLDPSKEWHPLLKPETASSSSSSSSSLYGKFNFDLSKAIEREKRSFIHVVKERMFRSNDNLFGILLISSCMHALHAPIPATELWRNRLNLFKPCLVNQKYIMDRLYFLVLVRTSTSEAK